MAILIMDVHRTRKLLREYVEHHGEANATKYLAAAYAVMYFSEVDPSIRKQAWQEQAEDWENVERAITGGKRVEPANAS
jgi:hypothetical protein